MVNAGQMILGRIFFRFANLLVFSTYIKNYEDVCG